METVLNDQMAVESALQSGAPVDWARFQRVVLRDLTKAHAFRDAKICGFSKQKIREMSEAPDRHSKQILALSNYIYLKSGYYRRLVDYYVNMAVYNWTADIEAKSTTFVTGEKLDADKWQRRLFNFSNAVSALQLEGQFTEILRRVFLHDACFGYRIEQKGSSYIYFFDPVDCEIDRQVNGMWAFRLRLRSRHRCRYPDFPQEIEDLIQSSRDRGFVEIPFEKAVCVKYFETFPYLFPPMFHLIADILDIDDFRELAKAKTEAEAYRLLVMKIPLNKDSHISLGDEVVVPFVQTAQAIVPEIIGVVPTPMDVSAIQFKSDQAERDRVQDATTQLFNEAGVSPAIAAGGTSGSEVKLSIRADEGELFRLYRQIERLVNTWMALDNVSLFNDGRLLFRLLDMTTFNRDEFIDRELKLAQASLPNKMTLCAALGLTPPKLFGNQAIENQILKLGQNWVPLSSSFTQTGDANADQESNGRPKLPDDQVSRGGEQTRRDDGNDPDNRA